MTKKYSKNKTFRALNIEVAENPWKVGVFANLLFIPTAIKNMILPLTSLTGVQFSLPSIPFYCLFSGLLVSIGNSLGSISEIFKSPDGWKKMSTARKI